MVEYAEEYLGLKGRAFAEEFVLRKQMDGVKQVTAKKPAVGGGGGGGAWGTSGGGGGSAGGGDASSEWENGIPGMAPANKSKPKNKNKKKGDGPVGFME